MWLSGACAFDPGHAAATGASVGDGSDAGTTASESTSVATTDAADASGSASSTSGPTTQGDSSTDTSGLGVAEVQIADGALVDFGSVLDGETAERLIEVVNVGNAPATALAAAPFAEEFGFVGGAYPGLGGDCGDTLAASATCSVDVVYAPSDWGPDAVDLTLVYHDGVTGMTAANAPLRGIGIGTSGELLTNGDAESMGSPPPGWAAPPGGGMFWTTNSVVPPHGGSWSIYPGTEGGPSDFTLTQTIDVAQWAAAIDVDGIDVQLSGWTRSFSDGNDVSSVRVEFLDMAGAALGVLDSPAYSLGTWQQFMLAGKTPAGTRKVAVSLRCHKDTGNTCDGFFDDLTATAAYP